MPECPRHQSTEYATRLQQERRREMLETVCGGFCMRVDSLATAITRGRARRGKRIPPPCMANARTRKARRPKKREMSPRAYVLPRRNYTTTGVHGSCAASNRYERSPAMFNPNMAENERAGGSDAKRLRSRPHRCRRRRQKNDAQQKVFVWGSARRGALCAYANQRAAPAVT